MHIEALKMGGGAQSLMFPSAGPLLNARQRPCNIITGGKPRNYHEIVLT